MVINISGLKGTGKDVIARSIAEQLEEIYKERGEEGHPNTVMRTVRYSQWLKNLFMEFFDPVQHMDLEDQDIKNSPAKNYVPYVNDLVKKTYMFKDRFPYDVLYLNDKDKDSQEHKDEIRKIAESIMMVLEM